MPLPAEVRTTNDARELVIVESSGSALREGEAPAEPQAWDLHRARVSGLNT